ncbi:hypothetical protein A6U86_28775 [Rhizobium sp. AC27/96]|uniref:hypothetical protein n=1 Tax=Rhizobium sp. AC27/96 TaxID=1841653 RepID=UPI000829057B|nr:hypothetical protein [Rhizobium sp. AC27/96]OCJ07722.1 hypothetical protein A6U86_28775 [Rhizobium sp. AC27/96]
MPGKAAIVLGHSHLSSIVLHLHDRPAEVYGGENSIQYYVFDTTRMGVDFLFSIDAGGGHYVLNPEIAVMVDQKVPKDREKIYISMFGGNAHNALTLMEHPRPFDFVLPEIPDLPLDGTAEFVTAAYINKFIAKLAQSYILNMQTLKNSTNGSVFHFESPPPIESNEFILRNLEQWFQNVRDPKISAPYLRYKLWRVHSKIIRDYCSAAGIHFLPTPKSATNQNGFLLEEHGRDSTHAGPSFGGLILKELENHLNVKYDGWLWL